MPAAFYRANARFLGVGVLLTLASSFGQTFFIAIFADRIMAEYGLSDGQWGALYTAATLGSAAALLYAGRLADEIPVARLGLVILAGFAAMALGMALNDSPALLVVLIFGLRFCGQGMISHLGITAMARWFRAHRARAVAIAGLGFALGEAMLPRLATMLEPALGWRGVWLAVACVLIACFAPLTAWLSRDERSPRSLTPAEQAPGRDGSHWTRARVLRHWLFWALMPAVVAHSFIGTAIFFQAVHVAEAMGWQKAAITAAYPAYAAVAITTGLAAGWMADRVGPDRLLPVMLLPLGAGVALIGPFGGLWSWWLALACTGVSAGIAQALWGALWAELYGTRHIGAIKAVAAAFMVTGSAIGPGVTGAAIDLGLPFAGQTPWLAATCLAISALHLAVLARLPDRPAIAAAPVVAALPVARPHAARPAGRSRD